MKKGMHRVVSADFSRLRRKVSTALLLVFCPLLKGREG